MVPLAYPADVAVISLSEVVSVPELNGWGL